MLPSVDPSGDPRYVPSYVTSVNLSSYPSEQQVRAIQAERQTTLEQVKLLGKFIA